jgi:hypothetical protein
MDWKIRAALAAAALLLAGEAAAQVTFYEREGFRGRAFSASGPVANFERHGFNDRASSVIVERGRWEVCEDAGYRGRCVVLRRGSYDSLARMGLDNRVSSVRPAAPGRRYTEAPAPLPAPTYEYRRRPNERLFEATITSVRAVGGPAGHRCWIERDQVEPNVGGAVAGAVIGGILGHQLGSGRGRDVGTVGGAVAGAIIGSQVGGGTGDVRRCERAYPGRPDYWDVTYQFRGVEHRVQMSAPPPGRTILVNARGEPRG